MSFFRSFFVMEWKRFINKKNISVLLIFFLLILYFVNIGIIEYKDVLAKGRKFHDIEATMFSRLSNYQQYSIQGIRLLFLPSSPSIFFLNSNMFSDLYSRINPVISLSISINSKSKSLFSLNTPNLWDLSNIILIFGSLLVIFWGYKAFQNKEYIRFLSSISSYRKLFISIFISRVILIAITLIFLSLSLLLLLKLHGIYLTNGDFSTLLGFLLVTFIVLIFFFVTGLLTGFIRSKSAGLFSIIAFWFCFVYVIPGIINTYVKQNASNISTDYQTELEKINIVTEFENRSVEKYGKFSRDNMELRRKVIEGYWKEDYKRIEALEEGLKGEIEGNIDRYRKMAVFTPVTFYQMTGNEVSSRGYENFLEFYAYLQEMKGKFVRFYIDRVYYNDPRELVSFIKGDENVFRARSKLPKNFGAGVLINGVYILLLLGIGYLVFKRYMFHIPDKKMPELKALEPPIYSKKSLFIITDDQTIKNQLYNVLNGKYRGFEGKVLVNDEDMIADPSKGLKSFVYLCHAEDIPGDIKVRHFVRFMQRLVKLSRKERARFYVEADLEEIESKRFEQLPMKVRGKLLFAAAQLRRSDCYVFNDFARGMTIDFLVDMRDEFSRIKEETEAAIIYLTADYLLAKKIADNYIFLKRDPYISKSIKNSGFLDNNKT
jgi:ABC-type Na+ transport system ATPase subunit NatA/ABC-type transport system involved in multi-copper enzyme maturation permease subunit